MTSLQTDNARRFVNHYRCPECGEEWQDTWSCACNDQCPGCGLKDVEPYESVATLAHTRRSEQ